MAAGLLLVAAAVGRAPNKARMESLDILPASAAVFGPLAAAAAVLKPLPATLNCKNISYKIQFRGSGMFIMDPSFFYPASEVFSSRIPDPHQRIYLSILIQTI
jgi:hypothetical protein